MQKLKDVKTPENRTRTRRSVDAMLWLIATSRNALVVVFASIAAYYAAQAGNMPFILTGKVRSGFPPFGLPPFHTTVMGPNGTIVEMNFTEMVNIIFKRNLNKKPLIFTTCR